MNQNDRSSLEGKNKTQTSKPQTLPQSLEGRKNFDFELPGSQREKGIGETYFSWSRLFFLVIIYYFTDVSGWEGKKEGRPGDSVICESYSARILTKSSVMEKFKNPASL